MSFDFCWGPTVRLQLQSTIVNDAADSSIIANMDRSSESTTALRLFLLFVRVWLASQHGEGCFGRSIFESIAMNIINNPTR